MLPWGLQVERFQVVNCLWQKFFSFTDVWYLGCTTFQGLVKLSVVITVAFTLALDCRS